MVGFENDELIHYGVKGMKWGVRKDGRKRQNGFERKVEKGRTFVKNNGGALMVAGLSAGLIASGHAYLAPFVGFAANIK